MNAKKWIVLVAFGIVGLGMVAVFALSGCAPRALNDKGTQVWPIVTGDPTLDREWPRLSDFEKASRAHEYRRPKPGSNTH